MPSLQRVTRPTCCLVTGVLPLPQTAAWRRAASLPTLTLRILSLLSTYAQRQLPYRVAGVDSNDVLYAAEPSYVRELRTLCAQVLQALLKQIAALGEQGDGQARRAQATCATQLFELLVSNATLADEQARHRPLPPACTRTRTRARTRTRTRTRTCRCTRKRTRTCTYIHTHTHDDMPMSMYVQVVLAESLFTLAWRSNMADKAHLRKVARMVGRLAKTHGKEYADLQRRLDVLC